MSKKKNTLKDLDDFLKQQAATLVAPTPLSEKVEPPAPAPIVSTPSTPVQQQTSEVEVSLEKILEDIESLSQKESTTVRKKIYDLILRAAEDGRSSSADDKMLINTVLYLTGGSNWKEKVRDYWRNKA